MTTYITEDVIANDLVSKIEDYPEDLQINLSGNWLVIGTVGVSTVINGTYTSDGNTVYIYASPDGNVPQPLYTVNRYSKVTIRYEDPKLSYLLSMKYLGTMPTLIKANHAYELSCAGVVGRFYAIAYWGHVPVGFTQFTFNDIQACDTEDYGIKVMNRQDTAIDQPARINGNEWIICYDIDLIERANVYRLQVLQPEDVPSYDPDKPKSDRAGVGLAPTSYEDLVKSNTMYCYQCDQFFNCNTDYDDCLSIEDCGMCWNCASDNDEDDPEDPDNE